MIGAFTAAVLLGHMACFHVGSPPPIPPEGLLLSWDLPHGTVYVRATIAHGGQLCFSLPGLEV